MRTFAICGVSYHNLTVPEALRAMFRLLRKERKSMVCYLNADSLYKALHDREYKDILNAADLVISDGIGLKVATRLWGGRMKANCNGTDLYPRVIQLAALRGYKFYFLGGQEGVAERAARAMQLKIPGLEVAGHASGYIADEDKTVQVINDSGADILLVGMGVPLQEKFMARNRERLNPRLCASVGALFDFLSGKARRAPLFLRVHNLEWVWRMFLEPKRLFKRYMVDGAALFILILKARLLGKGHKAHGQRSRA